MGGTAKSIGRVPQMLSHEDAELITRVGPDTPMGSMMREYWWPVMRSVKLEADGAPQRVRLLGEEFVLFRATDGRLGMFDEGCPHRGASLMLARNEDCALTCLLHSWKIGVDGKVLETPNEKRLSRADRIDVKTYPVREAAGLVWVWIGSGTPPRFPDFDFNVIDAETQVIPTAAHVGCNYLQLVETLWDPAHVASLHAQSGGLQAAFSDADDALMRTQKPNLSVWDMQCVSEPYGFRHYCEGGPRVQGDNWILTVMPTWVFIGGQGATYEDDRVCFVHVPIDDSNTTLWQIAYNPYRPVNEIAEALCGRMHDQDNFRLPGISRSNNWGQDREAMKNGSWTGIGVGCGIEGILSQDVAMVEGMGTVVDRTREHLGPADRAVIYGRRVFLDAVRAHQNGERALGVDVDLAKLGRGFDGGGTSEPVPANATV
jgi:phthalate 4,5-dioxygenase oxygenase subunit